jgi:hypothetical protein
MRAAFLFVFAGLLFPSLAPAAAQTNVIDVQLCPKTIQRTCFIAYVTQPNKVLVLLVSDPDSPLHGLEVEVATSPTAQPPQLLDLSKAQNAVVMLDGEGQDRIYNAKLIQVADPLLTALYVSAFLGTGGEDTEPPPEGTPPKQ